jgi:hypothetical protein
MALPAPNSPDTGLVAGVTHVPEAILPHPEHDRTVVRLAPSSDGRDALVRRNEDTATAA